MSAFFILYTTLLFHPVNIPVGPQLSKGCLANYRECVR